MRKITTQASDAFNAGVNFKSGNTWVTANSGDVQLVLHGHVIAIRTEEGTFVNNHGYLTNVTKERINGILHPREGIHQKDFAWYFTDKDGTVTDFPANEWVQVAG